MDIKNEFETKIRNSLVDHEQQNLNILEEYKLKETDPIKKKIEELENLYLDDEKQSEERIANGTEML